MLSAEVSGDRDLIARFDRLPRRLIAALASRFRPLADAMAADERARAPEKTGKLRGEIGPFFQEGEEYVRAGARVAADSSNDHAKAAALEYGARGVGMHHGAARMAAAYRSRGAAAEAAYDRPGILAARRYARGAFDDFRAAAQQALEAAQDER